MLTTLLFALGLKSVLKIESNARECNGFFIIRILKKWGETLDYVSCFSLHFSRALAASYVLYNKTEHSQGFSIC